MPRSINFLPIIVIALVLLFTVACEGPAGTDGLDGAAGVNGADGADGNVTCLVCHSEANIVDNQIEMARSQHGVGEWINYADYYGGGCARCHSGNGFIEWVTTGEVATNVTVPEAWSCGTCHGLHATFDSTDYALRITAAAAATFDATVTLDAGENNNLCVACHQARRGSADYWDGSADSVEVGGHDGPHHGPQSNILLGNLGATSTGTANTQHLAAGCVGCHMTEAVGDGVNAEGGHTFWPTVEACQVCHSSAVDFDTFGGQTSVAAKLVTLGGYLETVGIIDSAGHLHGGTYTAAEFQAWWNYVVITEDRSLGVHNPLYTTTLLDEAITLVE